MSTVKPKPPVRPPPKPNTLRFARAQFAYTAKEADELSFNEGDLLYVLDCTTDPSWWRARCRGKEGLVPSNFMTSGSTSEAGEAEHNPLHDACKRGNVQLLEECLLNRIPINVQDKAGNSGLHWAARGGHADVMELLLRQGVQIDVDGVNRLGDTALHLAARKGSAGCINLLRLTGRVDLNKKNAEGKTALDLVSAPEAKLELKQWSSSLRQEKSTSLQDYAESDQDSD